MTLPDLNPDKLKRIFYNPLTSEKLFETENINEATEFAEENMDIIPLVMEAYDKDRLLGVQHFIRPEHLN